MSDGFCAPCSRRKVISRGEGFGVGAEGMLSWDIRRMGVLGGETELPDSIKDPAGVWESGYVISPASCRGSHIA